MELLAQSENLVVCTDPGVDDVIALSLLSKLSQGASHSLMPVFTNGPIDIVSNNVREFIGFCAPQWTVVPACALPLNGVVERPFPVYFHGSDAVWNVHIDETEYVRQPVEDFKGDVGDFRAGISLGAMTSFSSKSPDYGGALSLDELWIMGGVFDEEGNETDYAETNIRFDPEGADTFFAAGLVSDVYVVPLDVTRRVRWSSKAFESIVVKDAMSWWIKNIGLAWYDNYDHAREDMLCLHDPLTVWLAFHPDQAEWESTGVRVVLDGEQRGRTVRDDSRPQCYVAMGLKDPEKIQNDILSVINS